MDVHPPKNGINRYWRYWSIAKWFQVFSVLKLHLITDPVDSGHASYLVVAGRVSNLLSRVRAEPKHICHWTFNLVLVYLVCNVQGNHCIISQATWYPFLESLLRIGWNWWILSTFKLKILASLQSEWQESLESPTSKGHLVYFVIGLTGLAHPTGQRSLNSKNYTFSYIFPDFGHFVTSNWCDL
jgi:hypothetical protein